MEVNVIRLILRSIHYIRSDAMVASVYEVITIFPNVIKIISNIELAVRILLYPEH